jgi:site-specific recombinase XerD
MATVHFYLKPSEKSELHIFLSLIYEKRGKPFRFYTNLLCPKEYWNAETERIIPPPKKRFDGTFETNAMLDKLATGAMRVKLRFEEEGKILTDEVLKNELTAIRYGGRVEKSRQTFLQFFEDLVERKKRASSFNENSAKAYITTLNHVQEFVQSKKKKFDFEDINKSLLNDFVEYLFSKDFQKNHVQKLASTLKTVLRVADEDEVSPNFKLKSEWLKLPRVDSDAIYLTPKEVEAIAKFDLSQNPRLDRVRDIFLIGCYTGLRFSDYSNLSSLSFKTSEDGSKEISLRAKKTKGLIQYPIFPEAELILQKYGDNPPSGISNAKMNKYLKELGKLAGIDDLVTFNLTLGGKRIQKTYHKWEKISTHTARRTFATNAMEGQMPVELIMHMTGHKNHKDFFKYIKFSDQEKNIQIKNHPYYKKSVKKVGLGLKESGNEFF